MSCSKWAYEPEMCDGHYCPGDCDLCPIADEYGAEDDDEEYEAEMEEERRGYK